MRRPTTLAVTVALTLALCTGCTAAGEDTDDDAPDRLVPTSDGSTATADPTAASIDADDATDAHLRVRGGARSLSITADADGGVLASADAKDATSGPRFSDDSDGSDGSDDDPRTLTLDGGEVRVHLDPDVAWTIEIDAGTDDLDADLTTANLTRLALAAGASSGTLRLGEPRAVVPIEQTAGLDSLTVQVPDGAGLRWTTSAGAGTADLLGDTSSGISAGTELTTPGLDTSGPYFDLRSSAGLGSLAVTHP